MVRSSVRAVLGICLLAFELSAQAAVCRGEYFEVRCHGGTEEMAQAALAIVDPVWPEVARLLGMPDRKPSKRLVTNLYRTIDGYKAADRRLTGGRFQSNLAMCDHETKSAHVALQPPCTDATLAEVGLPAQTIEMLAWESCHAARYELCPNFRRHPRWFVDGLAEYVSFSMTATEHCSRAVDSPRHARRIARTQELLASEELPIATEILGDQIDRIHFRDRYAVRATFFRFAMAKERAAIARVFAAIARDARGSRYRNAIDKAVRAAFGQQVDAEFTAFVQALEPRWDEVHRALDVRGPIWRQIAYPGRNAIAWRRPAIEAEGLRVSGSLEFLPPDKAQLNVLLREPGQPDFYSVAFTGAGGIFLFRYAAAADEWTRLGRGNAPDLAGDGEREFAVEVRGKELRVDLGELHQVFELPAPLGQELQYGLGAQAGSAGVWREVSAVASR